ncbi:MAG: AmmeMemoRadiSam system protein B [Candidatus Omnitrophota bacterium]
MEDVFSAAKKFLGFGNRLLTLIILCACSMALIISSCGAQEIKEPNVSGKFYSANPGVLSNQIDSVIEKAAIPKIGGDIIALISPHAGYIYSGGVAAFGYKAIKGKDYKTVIVIAPSHYHGFSGISVWPKGKFRTPLGDIDVDSRLASKIIDRIERASFIPEAFDKEHALEVQLPFLQKVLDNFKIVPIIIGSPNLSDSEVLASVLTELVGERTDVLIIASTDFSHYHPYAEANLMDKKAIYYLEKLDYKGLGNKCSIGETELCGLGPVLTVLIFAKENDAKLKILKYANSGDVTKDFSSGVVGYVSAVVYKESGNPGGEDMLTKEQKVSLIKIARGSLENYVKTGKRISFKVDDPQLKRDQGAFVTLTKKGQLRGCIGRIVSDSPLYQVIADMAIEAAVGDPRFPTVTKDELKDIEIDISALSPLEEIKDVNKIEVGKHGIIIRQGFNSGLLLPQVATEYGWDRETFLDHTCQKAGLPPGAWKDKSTKILIFSAEVFSEKEVK